MKLDLENPPDLPKSEALEKYIEFYNRVGILNAFECHALGICVRELGNFSRTNIPELKRYIKRNRWYHIVSFTDEQVYLNFYDRSASLFLIADGDNDPTLSVSSPVKLDIGKSLAIVRKLKKRNDF